MRRLLGIGAILALSLVGASPAGGENDLNDVAVEAFILQAEMSTTPALPGRGVPFLDPEPPAGSGTWTLDLGSQLCTAAHSDLRLPSACDLSLNGDLLPAEGSGPACHWATGSGGSGVLTLVPNSSWPVQHVYALEIALMRWRPVATSVLPFDPLVRDQGHMTLIGRWESVGAKVARSGLWTAEFAVTSRACTAYAGTDEFFPYLGSFTLIQP